MCQNSGRVAQWGQTQRAGAQGERPESRAWQLWAAPRPASSQGLPDLKSCSCRPWPGLNAWHGPPMFSEAANVSCLAATWSNPARRTVPTSRGPDKKGPIGSEAQAPGSRVSSLAHTCGRQAEASQPLPLLSFALRRWGPESSEPALMGLEALPEVLGTCLGNGVGRGDEG